MPIQAAFLFVNIFLKNNAQCSMLNVQWNFSRLTWRKKFPN